MKERTFFWLCRKHYSDRTVRLYTARVKRQFMRKLYKSGFDMDPWE